jgi:putative membrane protein
MCALNVTVLLCGQIGLCQETTNASSTDKKFVHSALEGENAELKLGQLAAQRGNSDNVKQFGKKMVDDHTKLSEQMVQIARREGIDVPNGVKGRDKTLEMKLGGLSGDAFDRAFVKAMVLDHRKDLLEFEREANSGNDTSIRKAATRGAQIIGEHLQMAQQMAQEYGGQTESAPDSE